MAVTAIKRLSRRQILALRGLRLPKVTLDALQASGIYCVPLLSVEYQRSASRYVIRGQESGGAVSDIGAYCGFVSEQGERLAWLQRLDSLGVNGIHARIVESQLVRVQVVRVQHTFDVLITKHMLSPHSSGKPKVESSIIFYARQGTLELDLWGKDKDLAGTVSPLFLDRAGEKLRIPPQYETAVQLVIAGASCSGCRHVHLLVPHSEIPAAA